MPNWCENTLRIVPETEGARALLPRIIELFSQGECPELSAFQFICPMPPELEGTSAPSDSPNWYNWRVSNWGTKWEECNPCVSQSGEDILLVSFQTAWSPPIGVYLQLVELGFDVLATYAEQGIGYAGVWRNGEDSEFSLAGLIEPDENDEYPEDGDVIERAFAPYNLSPELLPAGLGG